MTISTKTGDDGTTSLLNGKRVKKDDLRIEILGTLDELNAHLGHLSSQKAAYVGQVQKIQNDLFNISALIAGAKSATTEPSKSVATNNIATDNMPAALKTLELALTKLENSLPPLKNFIIPSGHSLAVEAHIARTVCRRAERLLVKLIGAPSTRSPSTKSPSTQQSLKYLNRLSDYLFLLARQINRNKKKKEIVVV